MDIWMCFGSSYTSVFSGRFSFMPVRAEISVVVVAKKMMRIKAQSIRGVNSTVGLIRLERLNLI